MKKRGKPQRRKVLRLLKNVLKELALSKVLEILIQILTIHELMK